MRKKSRASGCASLAARYCLIAGVSPASPVMSFACAIAYAGRLRIPSRPLCITRSKIVRSGITSYTQRMIEVPLTEAQFAAAAERLRAHGIDLADRSGTLSRDGVTARYNYAGEKLTIEVLDKPFFLPLAVIESQMRGYIQKGLAELDR